MEHGKRVGSRGLLRSDKHSFGKRQPGRNAAGTRQDVELHALELRAGTQCAPGVSRADAVRMRGADPTRVEPRAC
jgi:hypothetical protein